MLSKIDELREKFSEVKKKKDEYLELEEKTGEVQAELLKLYPQLEEIEGQIEKLLFEYIRLPECPFQPCTGRLIKEPTQGVLKCSKCNSFMLKGGASFKKVSDG